MTIAMVGTNGSIRPDIIDLFEDPQYEWEDMIICSDDAEKYEDTDTVTFYPLAKLDKVVRLADTLIVVSKFTPELYQQIYTLLATSNSKVSLYIPITWGNWGKGILSYLGAKDLHTPHVKAVSQLGITTIGDYQSLFAVLGGMLYDFASEFVDRYAPTNEKAKGDAETLAAEPTSKEISDSIAATLKVHSVSDVPESFKHFLMQLILARMSQKASTKALGKFSHTAFKATLMSRMKRHVVVN